MDFLDKFLGIALAPAREIEGLRMAARSAARQHAHRVSDIRERMDDLEEWIGELSLLNQTLLRLLLARGAFTKENFHAVFRELDLLDGVKDGKLSKPPLAREAKEREGPAGRSGKPHRVRREDPRE